MEKRRKTFEITEDGRYQFRPFGILGPAYEIPDRGGFNTARILSLAMFVIVIGAAVGNLIFPKALISTLLIFGVAGGYVIWLLAAKRNWKKLD